MEIKTGWVQIDVGGSKMRAWLAQPAKEGSYPAVLVIQEIFGVNSHIRDVAERVAKEGYVALAPEMFHRTAPGMELGYEQQDFGKGLAEMAKAKTSDIVTDLTAAKNYLANLPASKGKKVGCMGFCFGGHVTYIAACDLGVDAAASFYGGGIAVGAPGGGAPTVERSSKIRGKILCLFGGKDAYIPADQVKKIEDALKAAKISHEVVIYPTADHGFFCDQRGTYQAEAAKDAWEKVKKLFREQLA